MIKYRQHIKKTQIESLIIQLFEQMVSSKIYCMHLKTIK